MADPFIARKDLGDRVGRDLTTDDAALACIDAACEIVRSECGQLFNEVLDETIALDGSGTDAIMLPEQPATAISAVLLGDVAVDDYTLQDSGVLVRACPAVWTLGRANVEITYDHGYAPEDLPRDVRMVALTLAERLFLQGPEVSETLGAQTVRYAGEANTLMAGELRILRRHRVLKQPWATLVTS